MFKKKVPGDGSVQNGKPPQAAPTAFGRAKDEGPTALMLASRAGDPSILDQETPLMAAARTGDPKIALTLLFTKGASSPTLEEYLARKDRPAGETALMVLAECRVPGVDVAGMILERAEAGAELEDAAKQVLAELTAGRAPAAKDAPKDPQPTQ